MIADHNQRAVGGKRVEAYCNAQPGRPPCRESRILKTDGLTDFK